MRKEIHMSRLKIGDRVLFPETRNACGTPIDGIVTYLHDDGTTEIQTTGVDAGPFPLDPYHVENCGRTLHEFYHTYKDRMADGTSLHLLYTWSGGSGVTGINALREGAQLHNDFAAAFDRAWLGRRNGFDDSCAFFVSNAGVYDDGYINSDCVLAPVITIKKNFIAVKGSRWEVTKEKSTDLSALFACLI